MQVPIDEHQELRVTTLADLARIDLQVPELQRALDHDRVGDIVAFQSERIARGLPPLFIGPLVVGDTSDGTFWILDGQHRHQAMLKLAQAAPAHRVALVVLRLGPTMTMAQMFALVNAAVPVPSYVVESTLHAVRRRVLDDFGRGFAAAFGPFLSKTVTPRRPNVNLHQLQDRIHRADAVATAFSSGADLMAFVVWVNAALQGRDAYVDARAASKAEQKRCKALYLTADPDYAWLSDGAFLDAYVSGAPPPISAVVLPSNANHGGKAQVPAAMRMALWNACFGEREAVGTCRCCGREITQQRFHAGHVVAVARGGATTLTNLVPLCAPCNLSMGACSFDAFCEGFRRTDNHLPPPG